MIKKRKALSGNHFKLNFDESVGFVTGWRPTSRGSSGPDTRALDIRLEDRIPSAERLYNDVDVVLWGMVELVQNRAKKSARILQQTGLSESDITSMTQLGLPLMLGKPSQNQQQHKNISNKKKKIKITSFSDAYVSETVPPRIHLPVPPKLTESSISEEKTLSAVDAFRNTTFGRYVRPITHNAALVLISQSDEDGCEMGEVWSEGKILGIGPNSSFAMTTSLVALLKQSPAGASGWSIVEVPRIPKYFRLASGYDASEQWAKLLFLIEREEYASFDRSSSVSYYLNCPTMWDATRSVIKARTTRDSVTELGVHAKYWDQRYRLLSKWDRGCCLDAESWYSITPEPISRWLVQRCAKALRAYGAPQERPLGNCFDMFSGCGGCTFPLALESAKVFAVDLDPGKAELAAHNATLYFPGATTKTADTGVCVGNCNFMTGDVYDVLRSLPDVPADPFVNAPTGCPDVVILSPPWGGPEYLESPTFDLNMLPSGSGVDLIKLALRKCRHCCAVLPRTVTIKQLKRIVRAAYRARGTDAMQGENIDGHVVDTDHAEDVRSRLGSEWVDEYLIEDIYLYGKCKVTVLYVGPGFRSLPKEIPRKMQAIENVIGKEKIEEVDGGVLVGGAAALVFGTAPLVHLHFETNE